MHSIPLINVCTNFTNMVLEEHFGTGFKSYLENRKQYNYMLCNVILYLQPCQLRMEYHRDVY